MAKRQTIWLSTMMVLSLMLIGFYTVNNNTEPVPTDAPQQAAKQEDAQATMEQSDFFVAYHLEAGDKFSAKAEQLEEVIANGKDAEEVAKATKELETMRANQDKIDSVIDLLVGQGYGDAIVEWKDDKINVIVQAQKLEKKDAVKIMGLVSKELQVSSSKVTVASHE